MHCPWPHESVPVFHREPISPEDRDKAFAVTGDVLHKLVAICRKLEITPDAAALQVALHVHQASERDAVVARERAELEARMQRLPMQIVSEDRDFQPIKMKRGEIAQIISRPQWCAYRVEEIEIDGAPGHWRVHDILIGNKSQSMGKRRPYDGAAFRKGGIMSEIKLETCQTAMDFVLVVEYVGPEADGEVFRAVTVGTAAT